jgi:hypothetical protein
MCSPLTTQRTRHTGNGRNLGHLVVSPSSQDLGHEVEALDAAVRAYGVEYIDDGSWDITAKLDIGGRLGAEVAAKSWFSHEGSP